MYNLDTNLMGQLRMSLDKALDNVLLIPEQFKIVNIICNSFKALCEDCDYERFYGYYRYIEGAVTMLFCLKLICSDDYRDINRISKEIFNDIAEQRARKLSADDEDY